MRHQNSGITGSSAGPLEQQCPVGQLLEPAGFKDIGIELRQLSDEFFKFRIVFHRMVFMGNGSAPDKLRQRLHRWKFFQKSGIIPLDGLHPGLLKHDLGNPDMVGLPILPPGQRPLVFLEPGQQPCRKRSRKRIFCHHAALLMQ